MKIVFLLLALFFSVNAAKAATYYVATTGGGSTCSLASPCATIATGIGKLASGDTLLIRGGTYNEDIVGSDVPSGGGSWATATTIAAYPGNCYTAGTYGPGGSCETVNIKTLGVYNSAKNWIIFDGFHIDGTGNFEVVAFGSNLGNAYRPTYIKLANSEITNGQHHGINSGSDYGGSNVWYFNLKVHDNAAGGTPGQDHGIYVSGVSNIIENSDIYNNCGYGIQVNDSFTDSANSNIVRNNRLHNNGTCGSAGGMILSHGTDNAAYNNLSYNNNGDGFIVYSDNAKYYNNTAYGNSGYGINVALGTGAIIRNNLLYNNGGSISNTGTGTTQDHNLCNSGCIGTGSINGQDPLLTNPAAFDFTLQAGSPAINAGVTLNAPYNIDFAGTSRPQSSAYDIGAYEFGVAPPPPTPQLVLALALDKGTGVTADDTSGFGNDGTLGTGVLWDNTGKYGKALIFDGTGSVTIPNANSLNPTAITIEAWVYPTTTASGYAAIAVKNYSYYLYAASDVGACGVSTAAQSGYYQGGDHYACDPLSALPVNTWSHIAGTYDGTDFTYYRDGTLVSSINSPLGLAVSNGTLEIGASQYGERFIGKIDEVRIYNYARTQAEIQTDMATPLTPTGPTAVIKISPATSLKLSATNGALKVGQ